MKKPLYEALKDNPSLEFPHECEKCGYDFSDWIQREIAEVYVGLGICPRCMEEKGGLGKVIQERGWKIEYVRRPPLVKKVHSLTEKVIWTTQKKKKY